MEDVKPSKRYVDIFLLSVHSTFISWASYDEFQSTGNLSEKFRMWKTYKLFLKNALKYPALNEEHCHWKSQYTNVGDYSDLNVLILDYLTAEGYPIAAERFSKEANLNPARQQDSVLLRNRIQHDIHLGSIQNAIEAINELNPQVSHYTYFTFPPPCDDYCFMHHAYSLRVVDEKNKPYFSPQYEQNQNPLLHYITLDQDLF